MWQTADAKLTASKWRKGIVLKWNVMLNIVGWTWGPASPPCTAWTRCSGPRTPCPGAWPRPAARGCPGGPPAPWAPPPWAARCPWSASCPLQCHILITNHQQSCFEAALTLAHHITSHGGRAWHTRSAHTTDTMQSACVNKWKYGNQWTSAHLKLAKWKSKVVRRELCRSPAARTLMKAKQLITAETLLRILRNKREMSSSILYSNLSRHGGEG